MSDTANILVVLAHPALEKSHVNRPMADAAANVPNVTVHDLYEHYPDFYIDKAAEQALIVKHDVIVLQHPLYWYSVPALMKEWLDIVFEHGFAYGRDGKGLQGRTMMNAWTGGSAETDFFDAEGQPMVPQLMRPFECTAAYCGMHYLPPLCHYATGEMTAPQIDESCARFVSLLQRLQWPSFRERDFGADVSMNASLDRLETDHHG